MDSLETFIWVISCPHNAEIYRTDNWFGRLIKKSLSMLKKVFTLVTKLFASMDLPLFVKWTPSSQRWLVVICCWYMNSKSFLNHRFFNSLFIFYMYIDVLSDRSINGTNTLLILWFLHELAILSISGRFFSSFSFLCLSMSLMPTWTMTQSY